MMRLPCPFCGPRPESEFHWGGPASLQRPPLECDDETWGQYLFDRDNLCGVSAERWRHTYGCGQWLRIARDSLTHAISAVSAISQVSEDRP